MKLCSLMLSVRIWDSRVGSLRESLIERPPKDMAEVKSYVVSHIEVKEIIA